MRKEEVVKTRMSVSIGATLLIVTLALTSVGSALAQMQPAPVPGGMMGGGTRAQAQPLNSLDDATTAFQAYIDRMGNPDLALDEVMQFQWNYYAMVKEQSTGRGAFELLADPRTGAVFPEMGPNMMWNTRYSPMSTFGGGMGGFAPGGMMSGTWGPTSPSTNPTVTADQAQHLAQQWLDQYQPASSTELPDAFYGYYTLHTTKDGVVSGMLSVNAYTGQVWFHTWHGNFVGSNAA